MFTLLLDLVTFWRNLFPQVIRYSNLLRVFGIYDPRLSEGQAYAACLIWARHVFANEKVISVRVDYHPDCVMANELAPEEHYDLGPLCLVVVEDLDGYKPVEQPYALANRKAPDRVMLPSHRCGSLFLGKRYAEPSNQFLCWLEEEQQKGALPEALCRVLHMASVELRRDPQALCAFLVHVFGGVVGMSNKQEVLDTIKFILTLYESWGDKEEFPICLAYASRLSVLSWSDGLR